MRILRLVCFCVLFAGCSTGNVGSPPVPANLSDGASAGDAALSVASLALQPSGAGYKSLYSFKGAPDGANPQAGLTALDGRLYGTTYSGGDGGYGTVFAVSPWGTERVLYSFKGGTDGAGPRAGLLDVNGDLYGTTYLGAAGGTGTLIGIGTVFEVSTSGTERVLYGFGAGTQGAFPVGGLIAVRGTLYGTTTENHFPPPLGPEVRGIVFAVSTSGAERTVYSFESNGTDGSFPTAGLTEVNGTLYGTTQFGPGASGYGTVFAVSTSGTERVLYSFKGGTDGAAPSGSLIHANGALYGTAGGGASGKGTVFAVSRSGVETVLYSFKGGADGSGPSGSLIYRNGALYGTTEGGGASGNGTVFQLSASGTERVLYSFKGGADGSDPTGSLIDLNGVLYGTTSSGGANGNGTVFALSLPR